MGVLRPIVDRFQAKPGESRAPQTDKIVTVPTFFSLLRPIIGGLVGYRLLKSDKPVFKWAAAGAATDMEGIPGRFFDKYFPQLEIGTSEFGARADIIADSSFLIETAGAALFSDRISLLGKASLSLILIAEARKAMWAIPTDREYRSITGESLEIPLTNEDKESMAEKLVAAGGAVATADIKNPILRTAVGIGSLGFAVTGFWRGNDGFHRHAEEAEQMIEEARIEFDMPAEQPGRLSLGRQIEAVFGWGRQDF